MIETLAQNTGLGGWGIGAAYAALAATVVSAASLVLLHVLSPELSPSWRMVSEYAHGKFGSLLTLVFTAWAVSSFALLVALWPLTGSKLGKIGLLMLCLGGLGQLMGGLFDIDHKLHGPAAIIGIPAMCGSTVLVTMAWARLGGIEAPPTWSAHFPWISFVLMIGGFALFFSSLKAAGIDVSGRAGPLERLPEGVWTFVGWANRLIFVSSYVWNVFAALAVVGARR
jgi:hypothetical protein